MILVNAFREALKRDLERQNPKTSGLVFEFIKPHLDYQVENCTAVETSTVESIIMDMEDELDAIFDGKDPRRFNYTAIFTDAKRALLRTAHSLDI